MEIAKIAVSFHCDTCSAFVTRSYQATVVINVKIAMQKVGEDLEQSLMGYFAEFKFDSGVLLSFKAEIGCQYSYTCDIEWANSSICSTNLNFMW